MSLKDRLAQFGLGAMSREALLAAVPEMLANVEPEQVETEGPKWLAGLSDAQLAALSAVVKAEEYRRGAETLEIAAAMIGAGG